MDILETKADIVLTMIYFGLLTIDIFKSNSFRRFITLEIIINLHKVCGNDF